LKKREEKPLLLFLRIDPKFILHKIQFSIKKDLFAENQRKYEDFGLKKMNNIFSDFI